MFKDFIYIIAWLYLETESCQRTVTVLTLHMDTCERPWGGEVADVMCRTQNIYHYWICRIRNDGDFALWHSLGNALLYDPSQ